MKLQSLRSLVLAVVVVVATFDAITIPVVRLSVADCALLLSVGVFGFSKDTVRRICYFLFWIVPIVLSINAAIFFFYEAQATNSGGGLSLLFSGFVRPIFFVLISICFYGVLERLNVTHTEIHSALAIAIFLLSAVVITQYFGISPPMYHNNPSFGETGRYTVFSEGWRPTGLSNEASFVGIFMFLLFAAAAYAGQEIQRWHYLGPRFSAIVAFIGCFFTTSRLALLLAAIFFIVQKPTFRKTFIAVFALLIAVPFLNVDRFANVFEFDGDASTIERYGSFFAYTDSLLDPSCFMGTGYLNSESIILSHLDPLVMKVLGDRKLPAFSLPLQLLVEFGPIVCTVVFLFCWIKWSRYLKDSRLYAVILASCLTGVQNFIFVYIFIALVFYDRNTRNTQEDRWGGTHCSVA